MAVRHVHTLAAQEQQVKVTQGLVTLLVVIAALLVAVVALAVLVAQQHPIALVAMAALELHTLGMAVRPTTQAVAVVHLQETKALAVAVSAAQAITVALAVAEPLIVAVAVAVIDNKVREAPGVEAPYSFVTLGRNVQTAEL